MIFLLESPPASGKYFYDTSGKITEPLYASFMKFFKIITATKVEGLRQFCDKGKYLVDATYTAVNKMPGKTRKQTILNDYINLKADLNSIIQSRNNRIIIIKCSLYDLLFKKLKEDGYNVKDCRIPFPSHSHQRKFQELLQKCDK